MGSGDGGQIVVEGESDVLRLLLILTLDEVFIIDIFSLILIWHNISLGLLHSGLVDGTLLDRLISLALSILLGVSCFGCIFLRIGL